MLRLIMDTEKLNRTRLRLALMCLFRQGTTAQIFSDFVESSLRYRERALAALAEKRQRVER